ncbi:MAG TPA: DNA-processing protein DprA [Acidimicrobiia bacterium]|nr:DNA-processing protein DprA [Acidimicrobiia bacterium]
MRSPSGSSRPPAPPLDPVQVAAATLACLPGITTARLRDLVARWHGPIGALDAVVAGRVSTEWQRATQSSRTAELLSRRHPHVYVKGTAGYPIVDDLPGTPEVLLAEGDRPDAFERPRVAIVGTRAATPHGLADAREIGAVLGDAGITVVSGLAIGIDAAAHEGAIDAGGPVVGVVATGLDVVYPRRHRTLFERVRAHGVLVSELGYGVQPRREAFPIRNRIIASLADVVVVVEATARGGARITAERAVEYDRPVLAMPGSRRNPAAEGTNALIADGAEPLLEPSDVLLALGLTPGVRGHDTRIAPEGNAALVLRACGGESATIDQLVSRSNLAPDQVAVAVRELERAGWLERAQGLCWPR